MILVGLLLTTQLACALPSNDAEGEDIGKQKSAVSGGAAGDKYNSAVSVGNINNRVCSGTLIAPNLVLTARRCVIPPDELPSVDTIRCGTTAFPRGLVDTNSLLIQAVAHMGQADPIYQVKKIFLETESGWCGNDIALLELDENIPASVAQPATPLVQFSLSDPGNVGSTVTAVGYGRSAPTARDIGYRRERAAIDILCIPGDDSYDCDPYRIDEREFVTDGYVCGGDEGGGAYQLSQDDGTPYVLSAFSRADEDCRNAVYTRTDVHADLIIAAALEAAAAGGYQAPQWTASGNDCGDGADQDCAPTTVQYAVTRGCSATPRTAAPTMFDWLALAGVTLVVMRRRRSARMTSDSTNNPGTLSIELVSYKR